MLDDMNAGASAPANEPTPSAATPEDKSPAPAAKEPEFKSEADAEAALDDELAKVWAKNNEPDEPEKEAQPRDPKTQRFVGKEPKDGIDPAKAEKPAEPKDKAPEKAADKPAETQPPKPTIEAPRAWAQDMKAKWANVPADLHKYIADREQEHHETRSHVGRMEAALKPVQSILTKHEAYLKEVAPGKPLAFIDSVLEGAMALDRNPEAAIKHFAKLYGVDLGRLWDPAEQPPDPQVTALQRENAQLRRHFDAMQDERAAGAQHAQAARLVQYESVISEFVKDNPEVEAVKAEMPAAITALIAENPAMEPKALLAKAYEQARWLNPSTRKSLLDAEMAAAEKTRATAAREAADKARNARSVNVKGEPQRHDLDSDDEDERLDAIWRKHQAR